MKAHSALARTRTVALTLALVGTIAGCAATTADPSWGAPTPVVAPASVEYWTIPIADLGKAADFSEVVLVGRFVGKPTVYSGLDVFPNDAQSLETPEVAAARQLVVWRFKPTDSLKGGLGASAEILVMSERMPTDVPGVYEDPARTRGQETVVLLGAKGFETPSGTAYFTIAPTVMGASFALVGADGTLIPDPAGSIGLPKGQAISTGVRADRVAFIRAQLGLDA